MYTRLLFTWCVFWCYSDPINCEDVEDKGSLQRQNKVLQGSCKYSYTPYNYTGTEFVCYPFVHMLYYVFVHMATRFTLFDHNTAIEQIMVRVIVRIGVGLGLG